MLDSVIATALELRESDRRASFFVAKELALIEINMLWYPHKLGDNLARLNSLAQHVTITFKNNDIAKQLAADIRAKVNSLAAKAN